MAATATRKRNRAEVQAGALLVMFAMGALLSLAVLTRPVYARFGESPLVGLVPAVLAFIFFGLSVTVAGKGLRRSAPSSLARTGGIVMGVGFLGTAGALFADAGFWAAAIPMGVLTGAGAGMAFPAALGVLMRWFPEKRCMTGGWAMAVFFFGALVAAGIANGAMVQGVDGEASDLTGTDVTGITDVDRDYVDDMVEDDGLDVTHEEVDDLYSDSGSAGDRQETLTVLQDGAYARYNSPAAFAAVGILVLLLCTIGAGMLENPARGWTPEGFEPSDGGLSAEVSFTYGELVRDRMFVQLWLVMAGGLAAGLMFLFHAGGLAAYFDVTPAQGGIMTAAFLLAAMLGSILGGHFGDRAGAPTMFFLLLLFQALLIMPLLEVVENAYQLYWVAAFYGLAFGGVLALFPSAVADFFGTRGFVKNFGLVLSSLGAAALLAILLVGYLVRNDGDFKASVFVVWGPSVVAILFAFFLREPEKKLRAAARREAMVGEVGLAGVEVRQKKKEKKKKAKKRKRKKKRGR